MTLRKSFPLSRGDGGTRGTTQESFISPCPCTSTNIWAAAQTSGQQHRELARFAAPVPQAAALSPCRDSWAWAAGMRCLWLPHQQSHHKLFNKWYPELKLEHIAWWRNEETEDTKRNWKRKNKPLVPLAHQSKVNKFLKGILRGCKRKKRSSN